MKKNIPMLHNSRFLNNYCLIIENSLYFFNIKSLLNVVVSSSSNLDESKNLSYSNKVQLFIIYQTY